MQPVISTLSTKTSVGSPNYEYQSFLPVWKRARAVLGGQKAAREHDRVLDLLDYSNLLVPFSPTMSQQQYRWYVSESELPGMASQYSRVLLGGLLRKAPSITLPESVPEEALTWIRDHFTEDRRSIVAFLDDAVGEELATNRGWVSIDLPVIDPKTWEKMTPEERDVINPYPVLWRAEDIINWQVQSDEVSGKPRLTRAVFRYIDKRFSDNGFHPDLVPTVADHFLDGSGNYTIQYYNRPDGGTVEVVNGQLEISTSNSGADLIGEAEWTPVGSPIVPKLHGAPLKELPIFPLNGEIRLETPMLTSIIDKEVSIYNLLSRRNHLLYGASTYTPVLKSHMSDESFNELTQSGLGSWLRIDPEDTIDILTTPTEAINDLNNAILAGKEDLANLGTRMLSPDFAQSGIAMQIRNAPQTAQLGTLNLKVSDSMTRIIAMMLHWKYGEPVDASEIKFTLSEDFDEGSLNPETARIVTEWYQSRLIPRTIWLDTMKKLELIPSDYDDDSGLEEINKDPIINDGGGYEVDRGEY